MGVSLSQVDLHIHTTASDGIYTPSEVVRMALSAGLRVIAITDHDTLAGVPEAQEAARGLPLEVIPGVEVNSEGDWGDLHFLGYYVSLEAESLRGRLRAMRKARVTRAQKMVARLNQMGMPITWEEVRAIAGGDTVGRPHIAQALVNRGYVGTTQEAFQRFIGRQGPAYFPRLKLTPPEVIRAITAAGGVPVIAHPAHSGAAAVSRIPEFVEYGLRGVEVYYPHHSPEEVEMLLGLCRKFDLIATGGSDFHGGGVGHAPTVGAVHVPWECVARLRAARRNPSAAPHV
ncbi:MAG TPA: PHP domain-containing protein [Anaerolineae bacterium]|nr:PHP domain-containing protein [Anaerolineae bacterium]